MQAPKGSRESREQEGEVPMREVEIIKGRWNASIIVKGKVS